MGHDGIVNFLSVNGSLTSADREVRQLRLPRMNPFPKLNSRVAHATKTGVPVSPQRPASRGGAVLIQHDAGMLPEIATDVVGASAHYTVENVKRDRRGAGPWTRTGLGLWVGRLLGGQRATRP